MSEFIQLTVGNDWLIPCEYLDETDTGIDLTGRTFEAKLTHASGTFDLTFVEVDLSLGLYNLTCDDLITVDCPYGRVSEIEVFSFLAGFKETILLLDVEGVKWA